MWGGCYGKESPSQREKQSYGDPAKSFCAVMKRELPAVRKGSESGREGGREGGRERGAGSLEPLHCVLLRQIIVLHSPLQ